MPLVDGMQAPERYGSKPGPSCSLQLGPGFLRIAIEEPWPRCEGRLWAPPPELGPLAAAKIGRERQREAKLTA